MEMRGNRVLSTAVVSLTIMLGGCGGGTDELTPGANNSVAVVPDGPAAVTPAENASAELESQGSEAIQVMLEKVEKVPDQPNDQVSVSNPKFVSGIGGHFITANLRYGGGCRPHEFKAYWDGSWIKTDPPGAKITIRHNANGDTCKALFNRLIQINISDLATGRDEFFVELTNVPEPGGRVDVKIP